MPRRYWAFRISTGNIPFLWSELQQGRLRQGWGWDPGQDLRILNVDNGAARNRRMREVSEGDIILVPRLPNWERVAVVTAMEDWWDGYRFNIPEDQGDFGHIFPAQFIKSFARSGEAVTSNIKSTLRTPMRFWNMDYYAEDVDHILEADEDGLEPDSDFDGKLRSTIEGSFNAAFKEREFRRGLVEQLNRAFGERDWEWILVKLAQARYPSAQVESVGGRKESDHGTDVLIKIPGLLPDQVYAIAIQVKDWTGKVDVNVVDQIAKATYWEDKNKNFAVIDKIVLCVRASSKDNEKLLNHPKVKKHGIRFVFKEDLTELRLF